MKDNTEHIGSYEDMKRTVLADNCEFVILPNDANIGIIDGHKSMVNLSIIVDRAKSALKHGFFIEFISLKIQYLEFFLKIFWVTKNPNDGILDINTRKFLAL